MLTNPPLLEQIAEDPILRDVKLIAEAWDSGGAFHVLQKHWQVTCDHSKHGPAEPTTSASERWRDLGRIDAVKALLVKEGGGS